MRLRDLPRDLLLDLIVDTLRDFMLIGIALVPVVWAAAVLCQR